ncbi:MAG TPA: septal ring lytic transglycosylase RlpA family protein [Verrucomicrobiae bacterium]|nr:septal ring lytic transglycosylase RlpA family protein [Verrucomicrobiae bacterium]
MMNVSCPAEDQVRTFGVTSRRLFTTARSGLIAFFIVLCLNCHAADRASWYGEESRGLPMANGQRFNPDNLTAASWFFDLGTKVVVIYENRSVVVEITDRGPAKRLLQAGRRIDLSRAAFAKLADPDVGLIDVTVRRQ